MITYNLEFNDGERICTKKTFKEAVDYRSEHNFKYISRSIHIYATYSSKQRGCKLFNNPLTIKLV